MDCSGSTSIVDRLDSDLARRLKQKQRILRQCGIALPASCGPLPSTGTTSVDIGRIPWVHEAKVAFAVPPECDKRPYHCMPIHDKHSIPLDDPATIEEGLCRRDFQGSASSARSHIVPFWAATGRSSILSIAQFT